MYTVKFQSLAAYGPTVVFASDAPVAEQIEVDTFAEAFDYALEFGDDYQVSITPSRPNPSTPSTRFGTAAVRMKAIRDGRVCGTCADEGERECDCYATLEGQAS